MEAKHLVFFDKNGDSFNLLPNHQKVWVGKDYIKDTSVALYDTINIFILEETGVSPGSSYGFPILYAGQMLFFKWKESYNADNLFLYTVFNDPDNGNLPFIQPQQTISVKHSDLTDTPGPLYLKYPLQVNIAFTPTEEISYTRTLQMYSANEDGTGMELFMELEIYGEGTDEDERFRVWLSNFGIRFNKEDALILADYDLEEALPDWKVINQARKELLVNRDQVFPYVGTYKGLVNIINILGYADVLAVKEYWKNINPTSPYYNKMAMVDITSLLNTGTIDSLNLITLDQDIRDSSQFVKTSFLALVYEFTEPDGTFDDEGLPNVVETTEFTPDEIFFKLSKLALKLKQQFLPANVQIKDIIGEFIYFQRIAVRYWTDTCIVYNSQINTRFPFCVEIPDLTKYNLVIEDIKMLYRTDGKNQFENQGFNTQLTANPYEMGQHYPFSQFDAIVQSYSDFYYDLITNSFVNHGTKPKWQSADDEDGPVGCPCVFQLQIPEIQLNNLNGLQIQQLIPENMTIQNGRFVDMHEIKWTITLTGPNPYIFTYTGPAATMYRLPHILPYIGTYLVEAVILDYFGGSSYHYLYVTVNPTKPQILVMARINDKFSYRLCDLANLQVQDMAGSYIFNPNANILNNENVYNSIDINSNLLDMWEYINEFGIGRNMFDVQILDINTNTYKEYLDTTLVNPNMQWWGVAQGHIGTTLADLAGVQIQDMFHTKIYQNVWCWDFLNGFYLEKPKPHSSIIIGGYEPFVVPFYEKLVDLESVLNHTDHPALSQYNYSIVGGRIHAQAKYHSKQLHNRVLIENNWANPESPWISPYFSPGQSPGTEPTSKFTFFEPIWAYSEDFINHMAEKYPLMDRETLFLCAPTSDITSGLVSDPQYWINRNYLQYNSDKSVQTGFLPSVYDESSLSMSQIKITDGQLTVPKYLSVFFVINSVWGKVETLWNLQKINSDSTITNVISVIGGPFFIYRFPLTGTYQLSASVQDNNGNVHEIPFEALIKVVNKADYISYVETSLNTRMVNLIQSQ